MSKIRSLISALLGLLALAALVGMTACGPREIELPFETIEQSDLGDYSIHEPRIMLIASQREAGQLEGLVSQAALGQLVELDFQQYFAIVIFRGNQGTSGYDVMVERVVMRGEKVVVYTQFWEPSPHYTVREIVTSPYHIIKVRRDGDLIQEAELVLQSRVVTPTPPF